MILGLILVLVLLFMPTGILGYTEELKTASGINRQKSTAG